MSRECGLLWGCLAIPIGLYDLYKYKYVDKYEYNYKSYGVISNVRIHTIGY